MPIPKVVRVALVRTKVAASVLMDILPEAGTTSIVWDPE
jgi:hypothetical protein